MEAAIKKAIKGGWIAGFKPKLLKQWEMLKGGKIELPKYGSRNETIIYIRSDGMIIGLRSINDALLDPLFWQALGKAEGWEQDFGETCPLCEVEVYEGTEWEYHWHRFINHLTQGKDIDSFFTNLLQSNGTE